MPHYLKEIIFCHDFKGILVKFIPIHEIYEFYRHDQGREE